MTHARQAIQVLTELSIPLLVGVFAAMVAANVDYDAYHHLIEWLPFGHLTVFGHEVSLHFLVNDIFMVFFFGIAAKEITEAGLPGGSLNPISKAINPLFATMGGVVGPVVVFVGALFAGQAMGIIPASTSELDLSRGWGIPTATDIALAWLVARAVFGKGHPAIDFLLLLAVADDAIGLGIIAVFYGDPAHPAEPAWLGLVVAGMALAYGLRKAGVRSWLAYIGLAGPLAWTGLMLAHLHPALALVFIVPFMPGPDHDTGLFAESHSHSPLENFEHALKLPVDLGLFGFAFANAGVPLSGVGPLTWLVLGALVVGKTVGITGASTLAGLLGYKRPEGMAFSELVMAGFIAALGLTVALFVSDSAFADPVLQGEAKMGALFSGAVGLIAVGVARVLGMGRKPAEEVVLPEVDEVAAK